MSQWAGFQSTNALTALGAEWGTTKETSPAYVKETQRIDELERRLVRLQHLPSTLHLKLDLISTACLSLLDYINHPRIDAAESMGIMVKKCLNQWYAAPEVLFHALSKSTLDPLARWLIAGSRLWYYVLALGPPAEHVKQVMKLKKTRLAIAARELRRWKVLVTPEGSDCIFVLLPVRESWSVCRQAITNHIKRFELENLAVRGPNTYSGLSLCSEKTHKTFLATLSAYDQGVMMKIWTGAVMTRSKRAKMDSSSPECECGASEQTLSHLFWECKRTEEPDPALRYYHALPHSLSVSHLLPKGQAARDMTLWKMSCRRSRTQAQGYVRKDKDDQGHVVTATEDGTYVCCTTCYVTRKAKDVRWIFLKRCPREDCESVGEGER